MSFPYFWTPVFPYFWTPVLFLAIFSNRPLCLCTCNICGPYHTAFQFIHCFCTLTLNNSSLVISVACSKSRCPVSRLHCLDGRWMLGRMFESCNTSTLPSQQQSTFCFCLFHKTGQMFFFGCSVPVGIAEFNIRPVLSFFPDFNCLFAHL